MYFVTIHHFVILQMKGTKFIATILTNYNLQITIANYNCGPYRRLPLKDSDRSSLTVRSYEAPDWTKEKRTQRETENARERLKMRARETETENARERDRKCARERLKMRARETESDSTRERPSVSERERHCARETENARESDRVFPKESDTARETPKMCERKYNKVNKIK